MGAWDDFKKEHDKKQQPFAGAQSWEQYKQSYDQKNGAPSVKIEPIALQYAKKRAELESNNQPSPQNAFTLPAAKQPQAGTVLPNAAANNITANKADAAIKSINPIAYIEDAVGGIANTFIVKPAQEYKEMRQQKGYAQNYPEILKKADTGIVDYLSSFDANKKGYAQQSRDQARTELKQGLTPGQTVAVDIGLAAGDMATAAAIATATGMPITAVIGIKSGAEAAQQAIKEGYDSKKAATYGALSGATSAAVESLGGIGASKAIEPLKKTVLSKFPAKLAEYIGKMSATKIGQIAGSALSEGAEEAAEYPLQLILENLVLNKDTPYDVKEQAYSALIGGAVGGIFGGANVLSSGKTDNAMPKTQDVAPPPKAQTVAPAPVENTAMLPTAMPQTAAQPETTINRSMPDLLPTAPQAQGTAPGVTTQAQNTLPIPTKAQQYEFRAQRGFADSVAKAISTPAAQVDAKTLMPVVAEIAYVAKNGNAMTDTKATELFEKVYATAGAPASVSSEYAADMKAIARFEYDKAVDRLTDRLSRSDRYTNARQQNAIALQEKIEQAQTPIDVTAAKQAYINAKPLQREYDKVVASTLLTEKDRTQVDRLLKGEITPDELPRDVNRAELLRVYKAKKAYEDAMAPVKQYNNLRKTALREQAMNLIEQSDKWKDKRIGFLYSRETMERNIRDIVPDKAEADTIIKTYFEPVHKNEAHATRLKNEMRAKIRDLKLNKHESAYVQMKGEMDNLIANSQHSGKAQAELQNLEYTAGEYLKSYGAKIDMAKVERALPVFREAYNTLFELVNSAYISNGYTPIDYRKGYFPHFMEDNTDNPIRKAANKLGFNIDTRELPTDIAGLTHTFRPGKRYFAHDKAREGFETTYDALLGFDKYVETAADIAYHTDDIQRLRSLENAIRYKYSSDGIKQEIDDVANKTDISDEQKQSLINELYNTLSAEHKSAHLPHFAQEVRAYTDMIAGKKSIGDRSSESAFGRGLYNAVKKSQSRIAANMVAINPASWITNFIPLTQGGAQLSTKSMLAAARDTVLSYAKNDEFIDKSSFLTNRRGSEPLSKSGVEIATDIMAKPMFVIDDFTSNILTRGRYYDNVKKGMSEDAAVADADAWAASVIADRSKGALPTVFHERRPFMKLFTMFQVEVNNQLSHLFKDIPREAKERGVAWTALMLTKYFVGAYLFNELYEYFIGRRPSLDPIGILNETIGDATGYKVPNLVEAADSTFKGLPVSFDTQKKTAAAAAAGLGKNIAQEVPFVGGLLDGGRVTISSALPDIGKTVNAALGLAGGDTPTNKALNTIGTELARPAYYLLPPFGGGQIKKAFEGISTVAGGGSYGLDSQGRDVLQFPVHDKGAGTYAQAALFGKYATPTAKDYIDANFRPLSAADTTAYKTALDKGISSEVAFETIKSMSKLPTNEEKIKYLSSYTKLTPQQKNWLHTQVISDKKPVDYSSKDTITLSQMTDSKRDGYQTVSNWMSVSEYAKAVTIVSGLSKKEEIINKLKQYGYNQAAADRLYKAFKGKSD